VTQVLIQRPARFLVCQYILVDSFMMKLDDPIFFEPASDLFRTPILFNTALDQLFDFSYELDSLGLVFMALSGQTLGLFVAVSLCPVLRLISRERVLWERPSALAIWFIEVLALYSISI